jgi:hypothetical protein
MRGTVKSQVGAVLKHITNYGTSSRHEEAMARERLKASGVSSKDMVHAVAANTGIYGLKTRSNVFSRLVEIGDYCRSEFCVKDISKITPEMVNSFLAEKIEEQKTFGHVNSYIEALNKLEFGLEKLVQAERTNFYAATRNTMAEAREECPASGGRNRAYENPERLIQSINSEAHRIVATVQYDAGLRIAAASDIQANQLKGYRTDEHTGNRIGIIAYVNKGGGAGEAKVSPAIYQKVSDHIASHGELRADAQAYRADIRSACDKSGERFEASHGLRYNFAQERFSELRDHGYSKLEAMSAVSEEMGHHRAGITAVYIAADSD